MKADADVLNAPLIVEEDNDPITLLIDVAEVDEAEYHAGVRRLRMLVDVRVLPQRIVLLVAEGDLLRRSEQSSDLRAGHSLLDLIYLDRVDRVIMLLAAEDGTATKEETGGRNEQGASGG